MLGTSEKCHFQTPALQHIDCSRLDTFRMLRLDAAYLFERRQVAGAVPNAFLKAREKAASEP